MPQLPANSRLGRYVVKDFAGETVRAFVPPLPPASLVQLDRLQLLLEQANQAIGRLDGLASLLPNLSLLVYTFVRKEAVLSSQIEGTQSSLSDFPPLSTSDGMRRAPRNRRKLWPMTRMTLTGHMRIFRGRSSSVMATTLAELF